MNQFNDTESNRDMWIRRCDKYAKMVYRLIEEKKALRSVGSMLSLPEDFTVDQLKQEIRRRDEEDANNLNKADELRAENKRLREALTEISTATIGRIESPYGAPLNHDCPYCLDMREMAKEGVNG